MLATALAAIGALTAAGWWLQIDEFVQPFAGQAPLKINAALGFLVLGGVLLALELGRRQLALLALIPAVVGALTLAEDIFKKNLRFDELLAPDRVLVDTEQAGRMSAMVAMCLVLGGLAVAWRALKGAEPARLFTEAVAGSILASTGISTLFGYAVGLPAAYRWGTTTATSPVAAIALLLLGLALLLLAWRGSCENRRKVPRLVADARRHRQPDTHGHVLDRPARARGRLPRGENPFGDGFAGPRHHRLARQGDQPAGTPRSRLGQRPGRRLRPLGSRCH